MARRTTPVFLLAAGTALATSWSIPAAAQDQSADVPAPEGTGAVSQAAGDPSDDGTVQAIVVTAQRRSQNLQDVPISIQSISAEQLSDRGNVSVTDLVDLVPGLVFPRSIGGGAPYLRGIGNVTVVGGENAVAFYIDGVFLQRTSSNLMSFNNIERVEVLKGPQGTLFGRNAVGGLIHVITREPSQTPELEVSLGYGSYNEFTANLFATGGLTDNLAASVAVNLMSRSDGWGLNVGTGHEIFDGQSVGVQSKFLLTDASGRFSVLTNVIHNEQESDDGAVIALVPGTYSPGNLLQNIGQHTINNPAFDPQTSSVQTIASVKAEYEFDWATVSNLLAYEQGSMELAMNLTPAPVIMSAAVTPLFYYLTGSDRTWSNELQLQSTSGSRLQWVVGAFYMSHRDTNDNSLFGTNTGIGNYPARTFTVEDAGNSIKSYAVYGQTTYPVLPATNLTLGARYSIDEKNLYLLKTFYNAAGLPLFTQDQYTFANANPPVDPSKRWSSATWRIALDHQFTPEIMGYIAFNTGFKAGQFSTLNPNNPAADPEHVTAYTAGFKSELLDRRVRLNVEVFYNDYRDLQLKVLLNPNSTAPFTYNAAAGETKGVDAELEAVLAPGFTLSGAISYLDAKYTDFKNAPCFRILPTGGIGPLGTGNCDLSGARMIRSPELTYNLALRYEHDLANGQELSFQVGDSYNSGFYWDPDALFEQEAYHNVTASASWTSSDRRYRIAIWGKNLADAEIWTNAQEAVPYLSYYPGQPRTFGATFTYHH
jgi:iron complex outermembrane recepter protein